LSPFAKALPSPKYAGLLEYGGSIAGAYLLRRSLFMPWEIPTMMDTDFAREGLIELDTLASLATSTDGIKSERLMLSALEMQWYMRNQLLRDADWAGMAHSLEIRVPFVDMQLLSQFIEIPSLDPKQEKRMIARTVAPSLPEAILTRPKTGFTVPIQQWLKPAASAKASSHREWAKALYQPFANI
jgi:asparagine synthase (glutamine-hydrolysing)